MDIKNNDKNLFYEEVVPGVHLIVQKMDRESVGVDIMYHTGGSWFEEERDRGRMHLIEHCIVSRTKGMNHEQLKDWEFRENVSLNAFTSPLRMGLSASGWRGDFKKMFDLLWEVALDPTFDQDDLEREREIVLREISERRGDPNYRLYYHIQKESFTEDSINCHEVLGSSEQVAKTELEDFYRLHKKNISSSQLVIRVSGGGIDINYIRDEIKKGISKINFGTDKVTFENKPSREILGELYMRYGGTLYDRLRDQKKLVYGIDSTFDLNLQCLSISLQAEIELIPQILEETEKVFSNFEENFRQDRFSEFKDLIFKRQAMARDKLGVMSRFASNNLLYWGKTGDYDKYTESLKQVREEDMRNLYDSIKSGWNNKKVIAVSNNPELSNILK
jgi:predicted Zn-dependent peptidase